MSEDESHLNALAIGHYVVGGLSALFACIACLFMPVGTVLGIFSIIVLSRKSVKELYGTGRA